MSRQRKQIRLNHFDYSSDGKYFITFCTRNRERFFGEIVLKEEKNNYLQSFSEIGKKACQLINDIPLHFPHVIVDEFVVMPNHIHLILVLRREIIRIHNGGENHVPMNAPDFIKHRRFNKFSKPVSGSVAVIIQQFKSSLKRWCNQNGFDHFNWQARFHDRIIRDIDSYWAIKYYIKYNPLKWGLKKFQIRKDD